MAKLDLKRTIYAFHANSREERFASYDFCYDYFQSNKGNLAANMAQSCFRLWGYLASWGMLRGSSELLQKSPAVLEPLITYFDSIASDSVWGYDVPDYQDHAKVERILKVCEDIRGIMSKIVSNPSNTLITKIILGTLGLIPAFDTYFVSAFRKEYEKTCKFTKVDAKALDCLYDFYLNNQTELNAISVYVIDFQGNKTGRKYKIAKLIDMYGFTKGATKDDVLPGKFSVARGKQVQFSKGNLQYLPVENIWRFAPNQYDMCGVNNLSIAAGQACTEWLDLFKFENDFGTQSKVAEGEEGWHALSKDEWEYLLNKRKNAKELIAKGSMLQYGTKCLILLPDNWNEINDITKRSPRLDGDFSDNRFNNNEIELMEKFGAVFLPFAGDLHAQGTGENIGFDYGAQFNYWSSTECTNELVSKKEYEMALSNRQYLARISNNPDYYQEGMNLFEDNAMVFKFTDGDALEKLKLQKDRKSSYYSVRLVRNCK